MKTEQRIREALDTKTRLTITTVTRCKAGFVVMASDGTVQRFPSKKIALQFLLAIVRCTPVRSFSLKAVKIKS